MIMRRTSLAVTGWNDGRDDTAVSVMTGGGAAESPLMPSTLRLKKEAKPSAE